MPLFITFGKGRENRKRESKSPPKKRPRQRRTKGLPTPREIREDLRRFITFEKRLLSRVLTDPRERRLAFSAAGLMDTCSFYTRARDVRVSEYLNLLNNFERFFKLPAVKQRMTTWFGKEILDHSERAFSQNAGRDREELSAKAPDDIIAIKPRGMEEFLEVFFYKLLEENHVNIQEYNERVYQMLKAARISVFRDFLKY